MLRREGARRDEQVVRENGAQADVGAAVDEIEAEALGQRCEQDGDFEEDQRRKTVQHSWLREMVKAGDGVAAWYAAALV